MEGFPTATATSRTTWIFGYGSLVWKVDFPFVRKCVGYVKGYKRRFWLASTDHRGYPESPGRVVTLVPSENPDDRVWGVAYEIPADEATRRHLDHREKGGYRRCNVTFFRQEAARDGDGVDRDADLPRTLEMTVYIAGDNVDEYLGPKPLDTIADVIATTVGPSGKNSEYLLNLAEAMRELAPEAADDHLYELERLVRERLQGKDEWGKARAEY